MAVKKAVDQEPVVITLPALNIKTAIAELESYRIKYANLLELAPIWELLDKIKSGELVEVGSNAQ
jgi:hypothetical protein